MRLSLGMIFKDEWDQFNRIVSEYGSLFDEIVVAVDNDIDEFIRIANNNKVTTIKVLPFTWVNDFAKKRNFVHENVTGDYYLRLDSDDALSPETAKNLRKIADDAKSKDLSIVYGFYNYSRDQWGNVNAAHWRECLIKNTHNLFWNKKIHENILPKNMGEYSMEMNENLVIEHLSSPEKINESLMRNIKYLLEEYNSDKDKTDPRTLAYLGRMLHGIGAWDKAIYFLEKHIQTSGWDEDRYMSWCMLSDAYRIQERYDQATAAAFEALAERPDYPDAYLKLHDIYFQREEWLKAEEWGRQGLLKPVPKNFMMIDPSRYGWVPTLSMAFTLFHIGKFDEALKLFNLAKKDVPSLPTIVENEKMFKMASEHRKFMENYLYIVNYLKDKNEENKIISLLDAAPKGYEENEVIIKLRQHYSDGKEWSDNSVCIFALSTLEDWSPKSAEKGIGGSEEAVIHLSRELVKLGMDVTVFSNCGEQAGDYDGVKYRNIVDLNPKDTFNIFISWRTNIFENPQLKAKKRIVWLHDMPNIDFSDDKLKKIDQIVVLSKFHASLLPKNVPPEKIFLSTNGINEADFNVIKGIKREPHRVIYASSYDRGLEELLGMWGDVRKEVPDAELHVYYGWNTYDALVRQGYVKDSGFKEKMTKLMSQDGVFDHGKVGHIDLLKEYAKSSVMAYPCKYVGEINCIALTKAVACGCVVVSNDFAVMGERNPYIVQKNEDFKDALIWALKNGYKKIDTDQYIKMNSWAYVAKDWKENLFPISLPVVCKNRLDWMRSQCSKDSKIIDIGCNKGHLFDGWDRSRITSVDIDAYDLPNFLQADATKPLPFKDKEFDIAVLGEIIEHVDNPADVVREAKRIAKKLIITVPWEQKWTSDLEPLATIAEKFGNNDRLEVAKKQNPTALGFHSDDNFEHLYHKHFFTDENFPKLLNEAGVDKYKVVELRSDDWVWLGAICE